MIVNANVGRNTSELVQDELGVHCMINGAIVGRSIDHKYLSLQDVYCFGNHTNNVLEHSPTYMTVIDRPNCLLFSLSCVTIFGSSRVVLSHHLSELCYDHIRQF